MKKAIRKECMQDFNSNKFIRAYEQRSRVVKNVKDKAPVTKGKK